MKAATLLVSLSSELGWAAALIGACTLAFRNRAEEDDENAFRHDAVPGATHLSKHSATPVGFGM
jgi:hypothetical protein